MYSHRGWREVAHLSASNFARIQGEFTLRYISENTIDIYYRHLFDKRIQTKMFCVVLLQNRKKLVVPQEWVQQKSHTKSTKNFVSAKKNTVPNFSLPPKYFMQSYDACYYGYFISRYGKFCITHFEYSLISHSKNHLIFLIFKVAKNRITFTWLLKVVQFESVNRLQWIKKHMLKAVLITSNLLHNLDCKITDTVEYIIMNYQCIVLKFSYSPSRQTYR